MDNNEAEFNEMGLIAQQHGAMSYGDTGMYYEEIEIVTEQQKILAIAKAMYGDAFKLHGSKVVHGIPEHGVTIEFNPYTSAKDSQAVQEFFNINAKKLKMDEGLYEWFTEVYKHSVFSHNKDLKTAIADCAYEVVKDN